MDLEQANELILGRISECGDERTILGFLALSIEEEDQLIKTAKESLNNLNLYGRLRTYPACVAYFLAVSTSRCTKEGRKFWPRLMDFTGLDLQQNATRQKLASTFNQVCRNLDLLTGSLEEASWAYAAPFFFQAGILDRWTETIASGLRVVLSQAQAPNLDSEKEMTRFIAKLCANSHLNGMENLKHILRSEVGPLLIRSLVRAYHYSKWDLLPAHLRTPIKNAFKEVGKLAFLHTPYLRYNRAFNETELVLPAQNSQVASFNTKWELNESRYDALYETIIPVSHFDSTEASIELTGQNQNFSDRRYNIAVSYDDSKPFKVFNLKNGREKRLPDSKYIEISPDEYLVVMREDVSAGEDECLTETINTHKLLELPLRPGGEPLKLQHGNQTWSISSVLRHGFYTNQDESNRIELENQEELFYGDCYGIVGYFPKPTEDERVILNLKCADNGAQIREEVNTTSLLSTEIIQYKENIDDSINRLKDQLPYGVHRIKLSLTQSNKSISKDFWLWKGLRNVNELNGFECEALPQNLDYSTSRGVLFENGQIKFQPNNLLPFISLKITAPDQTLKIPRPGVQALVAEPGHSEESINSGALIIVHKADKRTIQLESGGFETWSIYAGNRLLVTLDQKRTKYTFSLAGLAAEIGHSGIITAEDQHKRTHRLLSFSLPLTSSPPRINTDNVNRVDEWSFKVATEGLYSLGYSISDLSDSPNLTFGPPREFIYQNKSTFRSEPMSIQDSSIIFIAKHQQPRDENDSDHSRLKVSISFDIDKLKERLYVIDIYRKTDKDGEWIPFQCDERQRNGDYNYSNIRLFAWGDKRAGEDAGFWKKLRRAKKAENSPEFINAIKATSTTDVDSTLKVITQLLAFKYPTAVWMTNAHRVENFSEHFSKHRFNVYDESANLWWKHAALELALHSRQTHTPVIRSFLFSTEPSTLRTPRESLMCYVAEDPSLVDLCMMLPGQIQRNETKIGYLLDMGNQINSNVLFAFQNFMAVHTKQANDLKNFSLSGFLKSGGPGYPPLSETILEQSEHRLSGSAFPLFSPEHMILCIRRLNTRCRKIQNAVNSEDQLPLQRAAQSIEKAYQQIQFIAPGISKDAGWSDHDDHVWTPPLLKNDVAIKIAHLTWMIAAIARLAANRKISPQQFDTLLENLLCRNQPQAEKVHARLNIILSLAPELFSCYMALFELSITSEK